MSFLSIQCESAPVKKCPDCGKDLSFWQKIGSGRCPTCQEEHDRQQAEARRVAESDAQEHRRAVAEKAAIAYQTRLVQRSKCPVCTSKRFRVGRLPDAQGSAITGSNRARFRPEESWIDAYALEALACLDCGHVRLFLFESDRAFLDPESPREQ